jgi:hypothetical protein
LGRRIKSVKPVKENDRLAWEVTQETVDTKECSIR